jgi:hypothetical protein
MNKEQTLGQLRAALTAVGTALATWGVSDGNQWAPIIGVIIAGISLTWGLLHHKDPSTPGTLSWSLVRKLANVAGSALVTYGMLNPERVAAVTAVIAALGPLLASRYSWVANTSEDDDTGPPPLPVMLLLASLVCLMPSCAPGDEYPLTATISFRDPTSGAKAGLTYTPRLKLRGGVTVPVYDQATGEKIGVTTIEVDPKSGK